MKYNDNSNWIVVGESGAEPVSLEELKAHLNMSFEGDGDLGDDDQYLIRLISACRESVENYCGISIKGKTIECTVRNECGSVEIPFGPVSSISSSVDMYGNNVTLSTVGDKWRTILSPEIDYIKITYTTGFMRLGYNKVPHALKQAILEECAYRYNNRGKVDGLGSITSLTYVLSRTLCAPYKRRSWLM